ncbi:MAG TPA: aminotransferase class I/II-fold pyridoxal phosphate-dependent enzyme [Bacillota bacterium]
MTYVSFLIERWMSAHEQRARFNLGESGVKPLRLGELLSMAEASGHTGARRQLEQLVLTYGETPGSRELRERVAALYGAGPDEVLITQGAIEANYLLFRALVEPGDVVVSTVPAYQQLYSVAAMAGAEVRPWRLRPEDGFIPDLEALHALLDHRVRLIVINSPHNPTGAVLDEAALRRILAWAEEIDAYVLCDEAYHGVVHGREPVAPPARALSPRAISVSTLSKTMGLAGLRIGWLAATAEVAERCWGYRDYVTISVSRLSDALACLALDLRPQLLERCRRILSRNLDLIDAWMDDHVEDFEWVRPRGGVVSFPRLRRHTDSAAFCRGLLEQEGVLLVPGSTFEVEGHVRLGIGEDPGVVAAGMERIGRYLRSS